VTLFDSIPTPPPTPAPTPAPTPPAALALFRLFSNYPLVILPFD